MLKSRAVVLDFEGFRNKSGFLVKEVAIATDNFIDIISFLPPNSYRTLSSSDQKSYQWVSKFLHGLLWETGEYPYCYLQQIIDSIILRFTLAVFYAKGKEKTSTLTELQKNVINLETLSCPKVEHLKLYRATPICNLHALSCPKRQKSRHCARKKAPLFYHWLMNESTSREDKSVSLQVSLSPSLTVYSCIAPVNQLTVTLVKEERIDSRGQTVLRKQQIVCDGAEIEAFKKYFSLVEYFQLYNVYTRENAKTETNPFTYAQACSSNSDVSGR